MPSLTEEIPHLLLTVLLGIPKRRDELQLADPLGLLLDPHPKQAKRQLCRHRLVLGATHPGGFLLRLLPGDQTIFTTQPPAAPKVPAATLMQSYHHVDSSAL